MDPVRSINIFEVSNQKSLLPGLVTCKKSIDSKTAAHTLKNKNAFEYIIHGSRRNNIYCTVTFKDHHKKIQHIRCSSYDDFTHQVAALYQQRNKAVKKNPVPLNSSNAVQELIHRAAKPQMIKVVEVNDLLKVEPKVEAPRKLNQSIELAPIEFKGKILPKYAISKAGVLSATGFMKWLSQQPEKERDGLLKWYFQQRKFAQLGEACFVGSADKKFIDGKVEGCVCDLEGYATSGYPGPVQSLFFMKDQDISKIHTCQSVHMLADEIPMGVYKDGKVMVQQQAIRSCVPTCAAMLLLDRGKKCDIASMKTTDLSNTEMCMGALKTGGLQPHLFKGKLDVNALQQLTQKYGSITCSIHEKGIGGHQVILDEIDHQYATIRDPWHGWRIRIPKEKFMSMRIQEAVYVTES